MYTSVGSTFFFLVVSAFCSLTRTALFSLSSLQIKQFQSSSKASERAIVYLLERPQEVMITLLVCDTASNILIYTSTAHLLQPSASWVLSILIPFSLTLFLGKLIPKNIGFSYNIFFAKKISLAVQKLHQFLVPIRVVLHFVFDRLQSKLLIRQQMSSLFSIDELRYLLDTASQNELISKDEKRLIEGFMALRITKLKHKMLPRQMISFYDINSPLICLKNLFFEKNELYVLVCDKDLSKPIGFLHASSFPSIMKDPNSLKNYINCPLFAPPSLDMLTLLEKMKRSSMPVAIVIDEYGSICGLITQKEIYHSWLSFQFASEQEVLPAFEGTTEGHIITSAAMELSTFENLYNTTLPDNKACATLGGWLTHRMGEIPKEGAIYQFGKLRFKILKAKPQKIVEIEVESEVV